MTAVAPSRSGRPPTALPVGGPRPRRGGRPPRCRSPSAAAQTATAVPRSTSRPSPSTPPAPQPTSTGGASASWTPSSVRLGRRQVRAGANTATTSARAPPSAARACCAASIAATRGSAPVDSPQPMRTLTRLTILLPGGRRRPPCSRSSARPGSGKTALALAVAERLRARGERPVAVSADALQVYRGLETPDRGAEPPAERARLEHRLVSILPVDARFSVGEYAELAHAEIDGLLAQGARPIVVGGTGLYLRAALAELDLRPAAPDEVRARWEAELDRARARGAARRAGAPRPVGRGDGSTRATAAASCARSSCSTWASSSRPPGPTAVDRRHPPSDAARRPRHGPRGALRAHRRARRRDGRRGRRERGARRARRRRVGDRPQGARLRRAAAPATSRRCRRRTRNFAKRQLTWMRKLAGRRDRRRDRPRPATRSPPSSALDSPACASRSGRRWATTT